jgi:alpha-mannosidase
MHDDRRQVEDRLDRVLRERIRPAQYAASVPLDLAAWHVPDEPVPVADALNAGYEAFAVGSAWGRPWSTSWFRATGAVPDGWAGRRVEAVFDLGFHGGWPGTQAEALAHDLAGRPLKGVAPVNAYVPIADAALGGEPVGLLIEAGANPDILGRGFLPTPLGDRATAGDQPLYRFGRADIAVLDEDVWHLCLDLDVLGELMRQLGTGDPRRHEILRAIERALDALDIADVPATAADARGRLEAVLARPAHASAHTICAVGHAHIDSAWLWPVRETKRKSARTFANATALAAQYPEFVFACSQAQQYAWIKETQPEIFRRIADAVKAGQWAPVGGMWVEADGNLPGGEALARQFVHGKRFFLTEFGVECQGVWLPDSFGYSAAFPQLARLAGMRWFLTQKISWNQTNAFPHHTFWWEGIDGTRIFTHFPPADTYNGTLSGSELAHAVANYRDKGRGTRSLLPFGHGDGGGGPTREMLERARRLRNLEGSPRVEIQHPEAFFTAAQDEYPDAPVWSGELYLELHRATYTSQARVKAGNRRSEHLLREAELWAASAEVYAGAGYPYADLDRLWKTVLLNQFHDILPGSSIAWVHREAEQAYRQVAQELEAIIGAAAGALAGAPGAAPPGALWAFNAGPRARREVVVIPEGHAAPPSLPTQPLSVGGTAAFVTVPASGAAVLGSAGSSSPAGVAATEAPPPVTAGPRWLDNGLVRVELDDAGLFTSVLDLAAGREVLAPGCRGNLLQLHTDLPNYWDAWDLDAHYRRSRTDLVAVDEIAVTDAGPLLGAARIVRSFGDSRITQTVRLTAGSRRIDVLTEIDWHEQEKLLKTAFPLDVHADRSTAEIQFGHVHRPTHANTSWDAARFEVCAHRWVHVAEPGYGVALITDSSYGYDAVRDTRADGGTTTTVRLSLVRAPRCPDPEADQGPHRIGYALLPGAGTADAVEHGYAFNLPLRVMSAIPDAAPPPLVTTDGDALVIEAVKLADDRSGDVVVRLYESLGGRARTRLCLGFPVARAVVTDLLERPSSDVVMTPDDDGNLALELRPFQVLTLRLTRG